MGSRLCLYELGDRFRSTLVASLGGGGMDQLRVGVLGCGSISDRYCEQVDEFDAVSVRACADLEPAAAQELADAHGLIVSTPDELIHDPEIDAILNLTPPSAHAETTRAALTAGNHVYVEKPLAHDVESGRELVELAADVERLLGVAPDTITGAGIQRSRRSLSSGEIGTPVGATAIWLSGGHEHWHPNPEIFYGSGGGPLFDMGPYYLSALIEILGSVDRVTGITSQAKAERTYSTPEGSKRSIPVEVPTHEVGLLEFSSGVTATVQVSYDTPGGSALNGLPFEVYGTEATLQLTDPNQFTGVPIRVDRDGEKAAVGGTRTGFGPGRGAGLVDLAWARSDDWEHRLSAERGLHVLAVLEGIREAADSGGSVSIESAFSRPDPLPRSFPRERSGEERNSGSAQPSEQ